MISKELLSEVLKIKIEDIIDLKMFGKDLKYYEKCLLKSCCDGRLSDNKDSIRKSINIYELAHKCKEWATENKYTILTEDMYPNGYFAYVLSNKESIENYGYLCEHKVIKDIPHNKTEPEAIFKACQWILESKKEGN